MIEYSFNWFCQAPWRDEDEKDGQMARFFVAPRFHTAKEHDPGGAPTPLETSSLANGQDTGVRLWKVAAKALQVRRTND